jgi:aspartyl-tRNA synthetase
VIFIDLRDRTGYSQIVFNPEVNPAAHAAAEKVRSEFVIRVKGRVIGRQENINPKIPRARSRSWPPRRDPVPQQNRFSPLTATPT